MEQSELHQKNKGGRPPKISKRTIVLTLKCSWEERQIIREKAKSTSLSVSEFLREMALTGKVDARQKKLPDDMLRINLLKNIGTNINQIAHKRHGVDELSEQQIAMLEELAKELISLADRLNKWLNDR